MDLPNAGSQPPTLSLCVHLDEETAIKVHDKAIHGHACVNVGVWPGEVKLFMDEKSIERWYEVLSEAEDAIRRAKFAEPLPETV